jgi:hypothetical protein
MAWGSWRGSMWDFKDITIKEGPTEVTNSNRVIMDEIKVLLDIYTLVEYLNAHEK